MQHSKHAGRRSYIHNIRELPAAISFQASIPEAKWVEFHCVQCWFTDDVSRDQGHDKPCVWQISVPSCSKVPEPSPRLCRPSGRKSSSIKSAKVFTKSFISSQQKDFQRLPRGIRFSRTGHKFMNMAVCSGFQSRDVKDNMTELHCDVTALSVLYVSHVSILWATHDKTLFIYIQCNLLQLERGTRKVGDQEGEAKPLCGKVGCVKVSTHVLREQTSVCKNVQKISV